MRKLAESITRVPAYGRHVQLLFKNDSIGMGHRVETFNSWCWKTSHGIFRSTTKIVKAWRIYVLDNWHFLP